MTNSGTGKFAAPSPDAPDEAAEAMAIAARIASGDAAAEGDLVRRYQRGVLQLLRCGAPDPELARDLCQETFVVVLRRLRGAPLEDPSRLAAFIAQTARNLLIGARRLAARRMTSADSAAVEVAVDESPSRERQAEADSAATLVHKLLAELKSERDRRTLVMYYLDESPKERICGELGITETQFNVILFRARERMRTLLQKKGVGARDLLSLCWVA